MFIVLAGPIHYWWDKFDTPLAKRYRNGRENLSDDLVAEGHLVYRPHEAFKGKWEEFGQFVNDDAVRRCNLIVDMSPVLPSGYLVPSPGTDHEVALARKFGAEVLYFDVTSQNPNYWLQFYGAVEEVDIDLHL